MGNLLLSLPIVSPKAKPLFYSSQAHSVGEFN